MKSTRQEAFGMQLFGRDALVEFDRVTVFTRDAHYGADADGNRGISMDFIDDDCAENVFVTEWVPNGDGVLERTVAFDDLASAETRAAVKAAIDDYLERTEPQAPEDDELDRWDYDRDDDTGASE